MTRDTSAFKSRTFRWVGGKSKFIDQLIESYKERASEVVIRAVTDMTDDIKDNTPVDEGKLVAHWNLGLNETFGSYDPSRRDPGRSELADPTHIEGFRAGEDRIYVFNKTPYAAIIEAIGSKSTSPGQMLAQQRLAWPTYVQRAAKDLGL